MLWHRNFLQKLKTFAGGAKINSKVSIACSGGADSIFLAHALSLVLPKSQIVVLIVNHNLQENSLIIAQKTQEILQNFGINSEILTWNHEQITTAIEEKARIARHNLIQTFCLQNGISTVFFAHHMDDKIETFIMNSTRGAGISGITSMREISKMAGITYLRPMVHTLEKRQILEFLTTNSIPWFEDESNKNTKLTRNKFRQMLQFTPQEKHGIIQTIQNLESLHAAQTQQIHEMIAQQLFVNFAFQMPISSILSLPKVHFRPLILAIIFEKIYPNKHLEVRQKAIENLHLWLASSSEKTTLASCIFLKKNGILHILPEFQKLQQTQCVAGEICNWNGLCHIVSSVNATIIPLAKLSPKIRKNLQIKEKFWQIAHLPAIISGEAISVPHLNILEFSVKIL